MDLILIKMNSLKSASIIRLLFLFFFRTAPCYLLLLNNTAIAETAKKDRSENILDQYMVLFEKQQKELESQKETIIRQGDELKKLKAQVEFLSRNQPGQNQQNNKYPVVSSASQNTTKPITSNQHLPAKPVGQPPPESEEKKRPPEIPRISDTVGGVLTKKGNIVFEPALEYTYTDVDRVFLDAFTFLPAIAVGLIDLRQIKRHTFIGSLGTRYGITNRLELEFRVPYVYRSDTQRSRPVSIGAGVDETFNATGNDIGDIEISTRYQLNSGLDGWPIFVANLVAAVPTGTSPFDIEYVAAQGVPGAVFPTELPTGSGYFSISPSVTALFPTDPAVFFANLSYNYNFEITETLPGETESVDIDPGDAIGLSFGMSFALNDRSSFSLGYSHKHAFNTEINGHRVEGSEVDIGQLLVGYSYKYDLKTVINLSLGIGTTDDAQDISLKIRLPITFDFLGSIT